MIIDTFINAIKPVGTYLFNTIKDLGIYLINIKKLYWIFIAILITYIVLIRYLFVKNPLDLILQYNGIAILSSIFGGFLILLLFFFYKKREEYFNININESNLKLNNIQPKPTAFNYLMKFFGSILIFSLAAGIILLIFYLIKNIPIASGLIIYLLNILIFLGIVTLIYKLISNYFLKNINDTTISSFPKSIKFLIDIIFYIPCLINDLISYLKEQYKITTKTELLVFISTILLIVLRYFLPKITSSLINHNGIYLSKTGDMYYLNEENQFGSFEELYKDLNYTSENENSSVKSYNYKYALSFWFYLDAQPPSTNYSYNLNTNILSYGNKPKIEYNGKHNELIISIDINNENKELYKTNNVPYQKWTNIIFNYDGGILDIFINNELVSSTPGVIYYMSYDNIITGKDKGIHGLIKNITYFNDKLSKNEISWIYNYEKL